MLSKATISGEMIEAARTQADAEFRRSEKPETIRQLIDVYLERIRGRYAHSRWLTMRQALARLDAVAGNQPIGRMDVATLYEAQQVMIAGDLCINTVHLYIRAIKRMFRWAEARRMAPKGISRQLRTMDGVRRGKDGVRDTDPVTAVPPMRLKRALRRLREYQSKPQDALKKRSAIMLRAMLGVQLRTGMRPQELCGMRWDQIDVSRSPWLYTPDQHKMSYRGQSRRIWIGPKAQRLILLWNAESGGGNRIFDIQRTSYRRKLHRWLKALNVPHFFPNQLRHSFATRIERAYDAELAQKLLDHMSIKTTMTYIDADDQKAIDTIRRIG